MTMAGATCIYGAGGMGREVLAHRRATNRPVDAFIDRAAVGDVDGVPVVSPDALAPDRARRVLVALHNPGVDVSTVVKDLERRGCADVATLWTICADDAWRPSTAFWLEPRFDWDAARDDIARARALLGDAHSVRVFDEQLRLREFGDYAGLSMPAPADQYVPADLARWSDPVRLVDCGAYDGDTLRRFEEAGYALDAVLAFEPDPQTYRRLAAAIAGRSGWSAIEAGVHASAGTLAFDANGAGSACIDSTGAATVRVVRLDDACRGFHPTLVKMDVEGAERAALEGARALLESDRPALAISVYHRVDDLWTVPTSIAALGLDYRFALRSHAHNGFDTVLYAWVDA